MKKILIIFFAFFIYESYGQNPPSGAPVAQDIGEKWVNLGGDSVVLVQDIIDAGQNGMFDISNTSTAFQVDTAYFEKNLSYRLNSNEFALLEMGDTGEFGVYEGTGINPQETGFGIRKGQVFISASSGGIENYIGAASNQQFFNINLPGQARMKTDFELGGFDLRHSNLIEGRSFGMRYIASDDIFKLNGSNNSPYNSFNIINNLVVTENEEILINVSEASVIGLVDSTGSQLPFANARQMGLTAGNYVWQVDENGRNGGWTTAGGGGTGLTFENGLTESNGVVKLGGTLTNFTTITGSGMDLDVDNLFLRGGGPTQLFLTQDGFDYEGLQFNVIAEENIMINTQDQLNFNATNGIKLSASDKRYFFGNNATQLPPNSTNTTLKGLTIDTTTNQIYMTELNGGGGTGGLTTVTTDVTLTGTGTTASPLSVVDSYLNNFRIQSDIGVGDIDINTDNQILTFSGANQSGDQYLISNSFGNTVEYRINTSLFDLSNTNELQNLSYNNNQLTISNGNTVTIEEATSGSGILGANVFDSAGNILHNANVPIFYWQKVGDIISFSGQILPSGGSIVDTFIRVYGLQAATGTSSLGLPAGTAIMENGTIGRMESGNGPEDYFVIRFQSGYQLSTLHFSGHIRD